MRTTMIVLAATALALTAGCSTGPERIGGNAVPAGGVTPATSGTASSAAAPTSKPTPSSPSPSTTSHSSAPPPPLVLGPTGLGALKIGMTLKQAQATGLITSYHDAGACGSTRLKAGSDLTVMVSPRVGLVNIPAYGDLRTPEGIHVGSTLTQVKNTYGSDFKPSQADGDLANGSGRAWASAAKLVNYRFTFKNGKVTKLELEHKNQDCYE